MILPNIRKDFFEKIVTAKIRSLFSEKVSSLTLDKVLNTPPTGNYMFKVNNRNTRKKCEICSKLTIKTPEQCQ